MNPKKVRASDKKQLSHQLVKYSTAAGAAVALSTPATPASAGIMSVDVSGWSMQLSGPDDFVRFTLDLNGDSVGDLDLTGNRSFSSYYDSFSYTNVTWIAGSFRATASAGNAFALTATNGLQFRNLSSGSGVQAAIASRSGDNERFFLTYNGYLSTSEATFAPTTGGSTTGFLGLSFDISGNTHYAWLEVLLSRDGAGRPETLEVLSGAYESAAGVDIAVGAIPEPASVGTGLGLLALGAVGLRRMRQRSE